MWRAQPDDLPLAAGELVYALVWRDDGWAQCLNGRRRIGYVPQSYVALVEDLSAVPAGMAAPRIAEFSPQASDLGFSCAGADPCVVDRVSAGSPAAAAGVCVGDLVLELNNEPCADVSAQQILVRLADRQREDCFGPVFSVCEILG